MLEGESKIQAKMHHKFYLVIQTRLEVKQVLVLLSQLSI